MVASMVHAMDHLTRGPGFNVDTPYIYQLNIYFYETASQSLALYERVWCTCVVSKRRLRRRTDVRTPVVSILPCGQEEAAPGGGDVRRLRRRYGRAGRGGTTNRQTDRQTDSVQIIIRYRANMLIGKTCPYIPV